MQEETGKLFTTSGILRYGKDKMFVEVDPEIVRYARALIPKWIRTNPQKYRPHISVVRRETPPNFHLWMKHEGEKIEFQYANTVHSGKVYWWLNAFSVTLEEIRQELGLPVSSQYTRPPGPYIKCFHITIGNVKGLE